MKRLIILILLSVYTNLAHAQGFYIHGVGNTACIMLGDKPDIMTSSWVAGYLTAYGRMLNDDYDISVGESPDYDLKAIFDYCKANPKTTLENAAHAIVVQAMKKYEIKKGKRL